MAALTVSRGLITSPNQLTTPDGALEVAENVNIDFDNIIESRRGFSEFGDIIPNAESPKQILTYKDRILRHYADKIAFDSTGSGSFIEFAGTYEELQTKLRIKYLEASGNLYFTTNTGIKKISALTASEFTSGSGYIKQAGGTKALSIEAKLKPDEAGFLPAQSKVSYKVTWSLKDANSLAVEGTPSSRFVVTNTSKDVTIGEAFQVEFLTTSISNGEYFIFNTTTNKYAVYYTTTTTPAPPATAETIGATLVEVDIQGLASATAIAEKTANVLTSSVTEVTVEIDTATLTITNNEGGDVTDPSQGTIATADALVSPLYDGSISTGTPANVNVTITVPSEVTTDHYYRIYRTAIVTTQLAQTLNDIDPGDEHQLVYESTPTSAEITAGFLTVEDIVPETFRAGGAFLYTNPVSGQGILQANERPPVAKDIASFRNSVFFANTREVHRKQLNLLSVTEFVSGTAKLYIGNSDNLRAYTFVGTNEQTQITTKKRSETVQNSYITLNSANDERAYYLWFDKGLISFSFDSTADVASNTITHASHGLANYDKILINGTPPTGLFSGTYYYVINATTNTFKLSATPNGSAITLTPTAGIADVTCTPEDPAVANRIAIRIPLQTYPDTSQGSIDCISDALFDFSDFLVTQFDSVSVKVVNTNNGPTTDPTLSSPIVPSWGFFVLQQGTGEDISSRQILLSGLDSAAQSVDETARSIERVINRDLTSPVNVFYLSGPEDLPGILLFENRNLEDKAFYLGITPDNLTQKFSPEFASTRVITNISSTTEEFTTSAAHGFIVGQEVYVNDNPNGTPVEFSNKYKIATVPSTTKFTLTGVDVQTNQVAITGIVYDASVVSDNSVNPNRVYYSKISQPESVPLVNYFDVGPKDKPIQRILALRDNLIIMKTDGIYVLSGPAAPDFSVRLVDSSSNIIAPDSAVSLNNLIYMLSTQGVVSVTETGASVLSRNIENKIKEVTQNSYDFSLTSFGIAYESDRSYVLFLPTKKTDTVATQAFRYNTFTRTWTTWTKTSTCGIVLTSNDKLYLGSGTDRVYIEEERKNGDRTDYCDRDFTLEMVPGGYSDKRLTLSSVSELEAGDVLTQGQYITVRRFNRLLKKLDFDPSSYLTDTYYSELAASNGDDMGQKLLALVAKLNTDLAAVPYVLTTPSGSNLESQLQIDYNLMIDELNDSNSGTQVKNYKKETTEHVFEVLVTDVDKSRGYSYVNINYNFIVGNIQVYKTFNRTVRYAPQHFGNPQNTKQINQGSFIFENNNFYGAMISYASDRSGNFDSVMYSLKGPGFWCGHEWGNVTWGGEGNQVPMRTLVPREKQRCRYITVQFIHNSARDKWRLIGVSLEARDMSPKAYRD